METEAPTLWQRVLPLLAFGWIVGAIRLTLDGIAPDWPPTMYIGLYFTMPIAFVVIGWRGSWGSIRWGQLALTMLVVGYTVFAVWSAIAYTTGQFMEWTHGRFDPGVLEVGADGEEIRVGARADAPRETVVGKLGAGLLHGVLTGVVSTVWCIGIGTLVIWLPGRVRRR